MDPSDYLPLVQRVARRVQEHLPRHVEFEELVALGVVGLLDACNKYDPERGTFPTYAYWRIRGAILDGLRALDLTPRGAERIALCQQPEALDGHLDPTPAPLPLRSLDLLCQLQRTLQDPRQLLVYLLRYFLGFSLKECGQILGVSDSHANSLHLRGIAKLRKQYRTPDQL
jgi:RNA polymerase sigma factor (sigma-70 family)